MSLGHTANGPPSPEEPAPPSAPQTRASMENEWNHHLCCDYPISTFFAACCCLGPCVYSRTTERLQAYPATPESPRSMNMEGLSMLLLDHFGFGTGWVLAMFTRTDMRQKFGIQGNEFTDCLSVACCRPCALAQMNEEIKHRADLARNTHRAYYSQPQMTYVPQQQTSGTVLAHPAPMSMAYLPPAVTDAPTVH